MSNISGSFNMIRMHSQSMSVVEDMYIYYLTTVNTHQNT